MSSYKNTPHYGHKVFLIRHGETEWSKSKQHTGLSDIPLTPKGKEEAKCLQMALRHIPFKKIFMSPLIRVQETCELAGFKDKAEISDCLLEWNYGDYEGKTTHEIREKISGWNLFKDGVINGETIEQVAKRADKIIDIASNIKGDIAFFASGHISRIIGTRWIGLSPIHAQNLALSTASISVLSYEHEWRVIQSWNDLSHLTEK